VYWCPHPCYKQVFLDGGVQAERLWQVAGDVAIGASSYMQGVILCKTNVLSITASALTGRILAQTEVALRGAGHWDKVDIEAFTVLGSTRELLRLRSPGVESPQCPTPLSLVTSVSIAATMTGFSLAGEDVVGQFALSSQVVGEAHGASLVGARS
jgi:hypothetical protein